MTREEIEKKIADLEEREFFINMVDRWTAEDYRLMAEIHAELIELKKKL